MHFEGISLWDKGLIVIGANAGSFGDVGVIIRQKTDSIKIDLRQTACFV